MFFMSKTATIEAILTVDIGLSALKTALFRVDGALIAARESRNVAVVAQGKCCQLDLPGLWRLVRDSIATLIVGDLPDLKIVGIGLSGAGNGLCLVTPDGKPIIGIASMDRRASGIVEEWRHKPLAGELFAATANHLWPGQPLPIFEHLQRDGQLPCDFRFLFCKDWVRYCLTGLFATDRSDASAAGLLDIRTGNWAEDAMAATGHADLVSRLPQLVDSCDRTGCVTDYAAEQTGLRPGTPVFGGGIDLALGAWADGLDAPGLLHVTAGTWSINQQLVKSVDALSGRNVFLQSIIAPDDRHRIRVDSSPTSAINIDMLCTLIGSKDPDFQQWNLWVDSVELTADDPIYLPYPSGAWDLPRHTAELRQLTNGVTQEKIVAAVYDGIAMGHVRQIAKFCAAGSVEQLFVCGGMTRNTAWCRRLADYTGLPVTISEEPHSSSSGAAKCAAMGLGIGQTAHVRNSQVITPDASRVCLERYQNFCEFLSEPRPERGSRLHCPRGSGAKV